MHKAVHGSDSNDAHARKVEPVGQRPSSQGRNARKVVPFAQRLPRQERNVRKVRPFDRRSSGRERKARKVGSFVQCLPRRRSDGKGRLDAVLDHAHVPLAR